MAYNVYQVSLEEGVRRVVVASSNHAADYYEPLILDGELGRRAPVRPRPLSDNFYGWAKEAYEHLGFVFAVGKQGRTESFNGARVEPGRRLEVVQIRIGAPRETDVADCPKGDLRCLRRTLAAYISDARPAAALRQEHRDGRHPGRVRRSLPDLLRHQRQPRTPSGASPTPAGSSATRPEDSSELRFAELIADHLGAAAADS